MLQLTSAAAVEVRKIRRLEDERVLRVWQRRSGRSAGITIEFVRAPRHDDEVGSSRGVDICFDRDLASALDGMVLDVRESRHDAGLYLRPRRAGLDGGPPHGIRVPLVEPDDDPSGDQGCRSAT